MRLLKILNIFILTAMLFGQREELSLERAMEIALDRSPRIEKAVHNYRRSYWQYRTYKANYLPRLYLDGTLPDFRRTISSVTQTDGSELFVEQANVKASAELSLRQRFGPTGGELFLSSGLSRIDNFSDPKSTSYRANPVSIGLTQPLFTYNSWVWDRKIEPLQYKTAKLRLIEDIEDTRLQTVENYFNLLIAQIELSMARTNKINNDTLFLISEGRYNLGKIAKNDLLQMELSMLSASAQLDRSHLDLRTQEASLKSFLRSKDDMTLTTPEWRFTRKVEVEKALKSALKNGTRKRELDRQLIEAERSVAIARGQNGPDIDIYANYGLTKSAEEFEDALDNPIDNQMVSLGISIPIFDAGLSRGNVALERSQEELVRAEVEQARVDLEREIELLVAEYNGLERKLSIAAKSDTVAQMRYEVAKQRYLIGKIGITDLNIAQQERDSARRSYISQLKTAWSYYFRLRKLTHLDPETGEIIEIEKYPDI